MPPSPRWRRRHCLPRASHLGFLSLSHILPRTNLSARHAACTQGIPLESLSDILPRTNLSEMIAFGGDQFPATGVPGRAPATIRGQFATIRGQFDVSSVSIASRGPSLL